jgi:hypothetical protein
MNNEVLLITDFLLTYVLKYDKYLSRQGDDLMTMSSERRYEYTKELIETSNDPQELFEYACQSYTRIIEDILPYYLMGQNEYRDIVFTATAGMFRTMYSNYNKRILPTLSAEFIETVGTLDLIPSVEAMQQDPLYPRWVDMYYYFKYHIYGTKQEITQWIYDFIHSNFHVLHHRSPLKNSEILFIFIIVNVIQVMKHCVDLGYVYEVFNPYD